MFADSRFLLSIIHYSRLHHSATFAYSLCCPYFFTNDAFCSIITHLRLNIKKEGVFLCDCEEHCPLASSSPLFVRLYPPPAISTAARVALARSQRKYLHKGLQPRQAPVMYEGTPQPRARSCVRRGGHGVRCVM